jgi:hypothetical protein
MDWILESQDKDHCSAVVNTAMNIGIAYKARRNLISDCSLLKKDASSIYFVAPQRRYVLLVSISC